MVSTPERIIILDPDSHSREDLRAALQSAGGADVRASEIGAHAGRFDVSALRKRAN